ncbi:MAG: TRIC cation channel family protein, partial [Hyphomicrobium sp.]|nr:TRIC cation channel family protein [Hyphomicrobium sp.]
DRALEVVPNPVIAIVMGVITATFGGIIRDILGGEVPVLLRKEIYVTAALAGAAVFVGGQALGLAQSNALLAGFLACLLVRGLALWFGWSLPPYRARPGRPQDGGRR